MSGFKPLRSTAMLAALLLVLTTCVGAQEVTGTPPQPPVAAPESAADAATQPPADPTTVRIGNGDLLDISVYGVPDLARQARVNAEGEIYLPLVGHVKVGGLTADGAQQQIELRLTEGGFLNDPHVSVQIKEYTTSGISIMGEVVKPGIYPLLGERRLFDGIAAAGGLTPRAGKVVSITRRDKPGEPILLAVSRDPAEAGRSNVPIYPGDTIMVSKAGVVYVVGEVARPKGIVLDESQSISVLQAIALAEGTKREASLDHARLIRKLEGGGHQEIPIPLKKIMQAKAADVTLQADDVLFVPASTGKNVAVRGVNTILQIATGIAIFGTTR
ncbi:MAG: polysaccharide export protein [Acidobacteria bacterium]|nr:polysaccharide export protein [Acidobacteriota bacterium]